MKKIFTLILMSVFCLIARSQTVVISQINGGGGNSGATYSNDYVELFNASSSPVDISGWSIQYANATNATGAWSVTAIPAATTPLNPGQYFLIKLGSGGTNGAALPTPDLTGTTNMGTTGGRVALVNNTTALANGCPTSSSQYVDLVGYGTTTTCFEGSGPAAPNPSATNAVFRLNNGCTDNNNNAADFTTAAANPRNTASPVNLCGPPTPHLSATPNISALLTSLGTASAQQTFNLSGSVLAGFPGNITVTPSANIEVSLTSGSGFSTSPISVPYTTATLASTLIYVRIAATAPLGAFSGTVTCSGGTAPDAVVTVNGGVYQNYYSKSTGTLDVLGTWGTNTDGSGATPANFTDPYIYFNVVNQSNATIAANWDVPGAGSRVVVGNGTAATSLTIPATFAIPNTTKIDVTNNATLVIQNNTKPFLNTLYNGSTVNFAETGTTTADTIRIPAVSYYNLTLTGGLKYFSANTTTVRGNLLADGVAAMNGNGVSPFSTINAFGDVTFVNNALFEPLATGDAGRLTLAMNGASGTQTITGNNAANLIYLFRLKRDSISTSSNIVLGPGTTLALGNISGGGLQLTQGAATTTTLTIGNNVVGIGEAGVVTSTALGKISSNGGSIGIAKTLGTSNAGTLRFTPGSLLGQLGIQCTGFNRDSIIIADNVTVLVLLRLIKGKMVVSSGATLELAASGSILGGTDSSFVDGKFKRSGVATSTTVPLIYPVGAGNKYAPVNVDVLAPQSNSYTVQYFFAGYPTQTIAPATLSLYPAYHVSQSEYWTIDQASAGNTNLTFYYNDTNSVITSPSLIRIAHFNSGTSDWNDLGGTPAGGNTTSSGSITVNNVSTFSPFTFAANQAGVVPIKLSYFKGQKMTNSNLLNWKVNCTSTSISLVLERSNDARNFAPIYTTTATQYRCNQPFDYSDNQPLTGNNYYRLKMIDIDGRISYSPVILIINDARQFVVVGLYPTMVQNQTRLSISSQMNTSVETVITDMAGQVVSTSNHQLSSGTNLINLDCTGMAKGIYNCTCNSAYGSTTIRFVKL